MKQINVYISEKLVINKDSITNMVDDDYKKMNLDDARDILRKKCHNNEDLINLIKTYLKLYINYKENSFNYEKTLNYLLLSVNAAGYYRTIDAHMPIALIKFIAYAVKDTVK